MIKVRVRYDGVGPVHWNGGPADFGLQDKSERLHPGERDADGVIVFDLFLDLNAADSDAPVFLGPFAHGPPAARFLYLSWRNRQGEFAQRLKLPLGAIRWEQVKLALNTGRRVVCVLVDKTPRATSTGANIGGTRQVAWNLE